MERIQLIEDLTNQLLIPMTMEQSLRRELIESKGELMLNYWRYNGDEYIGTWALYRVTKQFEDSSVLITISLSDKIPQDIEWIKTTKQLFEHLGVFLEKNGTIRGHFLIKDVSNEQFNFYFGDEFKKATKKVRV